MLSSDDVAVWTCSQFTVCVEWSVERRVSCSPFSIRCGSSVLMPAISWVGMWCMGDATPIVDALDIILDVDHLWGISIGLGCVSF